jgi:hypothetical protein
LEDCEHSAVSRVPPRTDLVIFLLREPTRRGAGVFGQ